MATIKQIAEMAGELRHALEQVSEPSAKEEKTELKKKRKQHKAIDDNVDNTAVTLNDNQSDDSNN